MTSITSVPDSGLQGAPALRYVVEPMHVRHIPAISAIERESFSSVWPASAYRREIERNEMATYIIAKRAPAAGAPRRERRFPIAGAVRTAS